MRRWRMPLSLTLKNVLIEFPPINIINVLKTMKILISYFLFNYNSCNSYLHYNLLLVNYTTNFIIIYLF